MLIYNRGIDNYTLMLGDNRVLTFSNILRRCKDVNTHLLPVSLRHVTKDTLYFSLCDWFRNRMLCLGRKNAGKILTACGVSGINDLVILMQRFHMLSLTDNYWVKPYASQVSYDSINLFENSFNKALFNVALNGKLGVTIQNSSPDLTQRGVLAKAYRREGDSIYIYKLGNDVTSNTEYFASKIAYYCNMQSVLYNKITTKSGTATKCKVETSRYTSWVHAKEFIDVGYNAVNIAINLSPARYYEMRLFDYITGNIDRHNENWAFEMNNHGEVHGLTKMYDFDKCFLAYDDTVSTIDMQTLFSAGIKAYNWVLGNTANGLEYFNRVKGFLRSQLKSPLYKSYADYTLSRIEVLESY